MKIKISLQLVISRFPFSSIASVLVKTGFLSLPYLLWEEFWRFLISQRTLGTWDTSSMADAALYLPRLPSSSKLYFPKDRFEVKDLGDIKNTSERRTVAALDQLMVVWKKILACPPCRRKPHVQLLSNTFLQ